MRLITTLVLLSLCPLGRAAASDAAGAPPQPPGAAVSSGPPPLDPVTERRAEQAADRYLAEEQALHQPVDPQALLDLANAEVLLIEAKTYLDQHDATKAGTDVVAAGEKLHGIKPELRPPLGSRYHDAETRLTALSEALLRTDALDPGHPSGAAAPAPPDPAASAPVAVPAVK